MQSPNEHGRALANSGWFPNLLGITKHDPGTSRYDSPGVSGGRRCSVKRKTEQIIIKKTHQSRACFSCSSSRKGSPWRVAAGLALSYNTALSGGCQLHFSLARSCLVLQLELTAAWQEETSAPGPAASEDSSLLASTPTVLVLQKQEVALWSWEVALVIWETQNPSQGRNQALQSPYGQLRIQPR